MRAVGWSGIAALGISLSNNTEERPGSYMGDEYTKEIEVRRESVRIFKRERNLPHSN